MTNVTIEAPLVNGDLMPYVDNSVTCKAAVEFFTGDDQRPTARSLDITIVTASGKTVLVTIPNDHDARARVLIDGEQIL